MRVTLYVIPASPPAKAAGAALERKGIPFRRVVLPPGLHAAHQRLRFGRRTVPAMAIDGERIVGSRAIFHRLDELVPDPPLYPRQRERDSGRRARVQEADEWGDEVLQAGMRRIAWSLIPQAPRAARSFLEGTWLAMPEPVIEPLVRFMTGPVQRRLNRVSDERARADLRCLPGWLDRVDGYIADGVLGGADFPNAADLQIGSSVGFLMNFDDLAPFFAGRPAAQHARRVFPEYPGHLPEGALPDDLLVGVRVPVRGNGENPEA